MQLGEAAVSGEKRVSGSDWEMTCKHCLDLLFNLRCSFQCLCKCRESPSQQQSGGSGCAEEDTSARTLRKMPRGAVRDAASAAL